MTATQMMSTFVYCKGNYKKKEESKLGPRLVLQKDFLK